MAGSYWSPGRLVTCLSVNVGGCATANARAAPTDRTAATATACMLVRLVCLIAPRSLSLQTAVPGNPRLLDSGRRCPFHPGLALGLAHEAESGPQGRMRK